MLDDDADLKRRFDALRREDSAGTPPFLRSWAAARRRRNPGRHGAAWVTALAAAGLILAISWPRGAAVETRSPSAVISIVEWRSPTAFLLDTPGGALLNTVPTLGRLATPSSTLFQPTPSPSPATKGEMS